MAELQSGEMSSFWLLDVVVRYRTPLRNLMPDPEDPDSFAILFNRAPHGLAEPDLTALLHTLFERGLLLAWQPGVVAPWDAGPAGFTPPREQIDAALRVRPPVSTDSGAAHAPDDLWYGLSAAGGAWWESRARPDWNRFVDQEESHGATLEEALGVWEAESDAAAGNADESSVPQILHVQRASISAALLEDLLRIDRDVYRMVDTASIRRDVLRPWDASYWKRFDTGHRMQYSLWPEDQLAERGASIRRYADMDDISRPTFDRWGPSWYTDFVTGEPQM